MRFKQLLEYFNRPIEKGKTPILHNLTTQKDNLQRIEAEFLTNATYQKRTKNTVTLYHEILSLAEQDKEQVTEAILTDLTRKYLELRATNALAYAKYQYDTENRHVHILISGNEYHSTKQVRLSKYDFQKIKQELEVYQQQRYPELSHSLIFDQQAKQERKARDREQGKDQPDQIRSSWKEEERRKRYERQGKEAPPTRKEQIRQQLLTIFMLSRSQADFVERCRDGRLKMYERGDNKFAGVETEDGYKYRFKTLGLGELIAKEQQRWEDFPRIMERMEQIEFIRLEQEYIEPLQFKEDIQHVLNETPDQYQGLDEAQKASMRRIDQHHKYRRSRGREDFMKGRDMDDDLGRSFF